MKKMSTNRSTPHLRQFAPVKYKKAPQAPRRFKSSYMFFSTHKHKAIRAELAEKGEGQKLSTTEVAKMVSRAWKALPEDERETWTEMARQDKARYEMEKSMYTGPWKVPATKRVTKDPKAPKRPMSAFLSFSNSKRAYVKNKHKDAKNAEVSRILAQMWKDADEEEKKTFIDEEFALRQQYKVAMSEWKRQSEEEIESKRKEREDEAMRAVREGKLPVSKDKRSKAGGVEDTVPNTGLNYSTKMADETFGQTAFPTATQTLSSSNRVQQNYTYPGGEYSQQNYQQYYPHMATSHFSPEQQPSMGPYEPNPMPGNSTNGYDDYERGYDGVAAMGYGSYYGQPHPYGYAPQAYHEQDYSQGAYHPPDYAAHQNGHNVGDKPPLFSNGYEPHKRTFDQDNNTLSR